MKTGTAELPLHHGRAPRWLFQKMTMLSRAIIETIVMDGGSRGFLERIADPYWFQAFGSVLGFDWHSSGLTTTVCAAMKQGTRDIVQDLGLFFCGGKGGVSRKTPLQIQTYAEGLDHDPAGLVYASKMSAKVDNTCLQDGYTLYHHMFVFSRDWDWAVVQQGMNAMNQQARRYHWLSTHVSSYVCEPHSAVCCDTQVPTLNMVARESDASRTVCARLACENPDEIIRESRSILQLPARHPVLSVDINSRYLYKILLKTYEQMPAGFEQLISIPGVGPKTIRALALISEVVYKKTPSFQDPARYSFAHGGKDGYPFPVDRQTYDRSISFLESAIKRAKIGHSDRLKMLKKLSKL